MIFRVYYYLNGAHYHMRFFAGKRGENLGKCGDLVMREEEFESFQSVFQAFVEFLPEERVI